MPKLSLLLLLIAVGYLDIFAQEQFAPIDAEWKLRGWVEFGGTYDCEQTDCIGDFKMIKVKDTVTIDNRLYSVLSFYRGSDKTNISSRSTEWLIHYNNNVLYFLDRDTLFPVIDFNLEVGDTMTHYGPYNASDASTYFHANSPEYGSVGYGQSVVSNIEYITIGGVSRKKMDFTSLWLTAYEPDENNILGISSAIEGIGFIGGFFGDSNVLIACGCYGQFLCFKSDEYSYNHYYDDCECDFQDRVLDVEDNDRLPFRVFPNPAKEFLMIHDMDFLKEVELYDETGRVIISNITSSRLDISHLSPGSYVLKGFIDGKLHSKKVVVLR